MFIVGDYNIDSIHDTDAESLSKLMTANFERFHRYFPKTLEQNLSSKNSKLFIQNKTEQFNSKTEFLFVLKEMTKVIGLIYIKELDWTKKQGEFAYCIGKEYSGKGLMSETVKRLSAYAFNELGLEILQIMVHKDNIPSVMVAKNGGFRWQRTVLKSYAPPNEEALDMELYELYK